MGHNVPHIHFLIDYTSENLPDTALPIDPGLGPTLEQHRQCTLARDGIRDWSGDLPIAGQPNPLTTSLPSPRGGPADNSSVAAPGCDLPRWSYLFLQQQRGNVFISSLSFFVFFCETNDVVQCVRCWCSSEYSSYTGHVVLWYFIPCVEQWTWLQWHSPPHTNLHVSLYYLAEMQQWAHK